MITEKDEFIYHEMISNVPMAVNPDIKKVLIIGGGDGGTAREVCRFKTVEQVDMVEIDERVVRLCQKYFPQTACALDNDPRINLIFGDGLKFVQDAPEGAYDLYSSILQIRLDLANVFLRPSFTAIATGR